MVKKFWHELPKILNQGVIYEHRHGSSFVYVLTVNTEGKFVIRKWRYWKNACHGRKPVEEFAFEKASDALAKFEEIKHQPWAKWDSFEKLYYVD